MKKIKRFKYEILVVLFFILIRVPNLGRDVFNTDVWKWKARTYDFSTGIFTLDFEKTYQKYHPGVTLMWIGAAADKIDSVMNLLHLVNDCGVSGCDEISYIFEMHFIQKLLVVMVIGISISFCFYVLRSMFGLKFAIFSIFLLSFEPFYLALTRVFHLEGLVSTFMLASALWLYYYLSDERYKKRLLVSGIFGGLAFLTKTSSIYLIPFVCLIFFIDKIRKKELKKMFFPILKWLGISLFIFYILWPAIWVKPFYVLSQLYRGVAVIGVERDHLQMYFGNLVDNPGITFYPVVLGLKSSVFLLPGLIGSLFVLKSLDTKKKSLVEFLLIYSFFYLVQLSIPSKKLDRYILPALISLSLISTVFYHWVLEKLDKGRKTLPIFLMFTPVLVSFFLHPDYLSYYNPLFGGLRAGIKVLEPKWMIGGREVVTYFKDKKVLEGWKDTSRYDSLEHLIDSEGVKDILLVGFPEKYYTQIWPFFEDENMRATIKDLTAFAKHAKYFVYPVWSDDSSLEDRFDIQYEGSIKKNGVGLYNVYRRVF